MPRVDRFQMRVDLSKAIDKAEALRKAADSRRHNKQIEADFRKAATEEDRLMKEYQEIEDLDRETEKLRKRYKTTEEGTRRVP